MILILDCTRQDLPLLKDEFVQPVLQIIRQAGYEARIEPLNSPNMPPGCNAVILTGTALQDHEFLATGLPKWLLGWTGPVLGICAGMQLLAMSAGGELIADEKIGMTEITVMKDDPVFSGRDRFNAWELHKSGVVVPQSVHILARGATGVQALRYADRPWYGVLFHPEVRNDWVIRRFLEVYVPRTGDVPRQA